MPPLAQPELQMAVREIKIVLHVHMCVCVFVCVRACVCVFVHACVCMCVFVYRACMYNHYVLHN